MENIILSYLKQEQITQTKLSERAGISRQLIQWHIKNPKAAWRGQNAIKIERATGGKVLAYDLVFTN
ncbi:MAG: helix-turn-helix domain-containing protein [Nanoarchaeota archaeon]|nr:helix-turn-helix domain-containing protein [Nanoarchaeota archaeon]